MIRLYSALTFLSILTYINAETCTLSTEPYTATEKDSEFIPGIPSNVAQCPGGLTVGNFQQNDACRLQGVAMESTSEHQFELSKIINFRTQMLKGNHATLLPAGSTTSNFGDRNIKGQVKLQLPEVATGEGHRFIKSKVTLKVDTTELQRYQSCSVINMESDLAKYTSFVPHGKVLGYCWNTGNSAYDTTLSTLDSCHAFDDANGAETLNIGTCSSSDHGVKEGCPAEGGDGDPRLIIPFKVPMDVVTPQKSAYVNSALGGIVYNEINSLFREEGTCSYTPDGGTATTYKGVTKGECLGYCNDHTDKTLGQCTGGNLAWVSASDDHVTSIASATDVTWESDLEFSCEYVIHNQMYVGTLKLGLAFEKTANTVGVGGSVLTKIIVPMKITPGLNDPNFFQAEQKGYISNSFQNSMLRDLVVSYDTACVSPGGYLIRDRYHSDNAFRQTSGGTECHTGGFVNGVNDNDDPKEVLGSFSNAGTVSLKMTGVFLDERYKIVSQSGVETLTSSMGDFLVLKQGMELHLDYRSFNDVTKDRFSQGADNSINLSPIDFRHRKKAGSTVNHVEEAENGGSGAKYKDFSNKGAPLDANNQPQLQIYGANIASTDPNQRFKASGAGITDIGATDINNAYRCELGVDDKGVNDMSFSYTTPLVERGECHAQYLMSHTFEFQYGDLPHFKPEYLACDICDSQLAIKGFKETDGTNERYQINTKLSVSIPNLPTSPNKIQLANVQLNARSNQFKLQPSLYYKLSEFFDVEAVPDKLLVQSTSGLEIDSLDNSLDFDEYFTFSTNDARGFPVPSSCDGTSDTSCGVGVNCLDRSDDGLGFVCENVMVFDGTDDGQSVGDPNNCESLKSLKVYQLKTDTRQGFEDLFNTECYIKVPSNYYGSTYDIKFENAQLGTCSVAGHDDKVDCIDNSGVWTSAIPSETTEIKEVDRRKILISNPEDDQSTTLTLTERVQASVSRVATTITMEFIKELPGKTIPDGLQHPAGANLQEQYITFRLKGDTSALSGYITTSDGSGECAGNNMYWKQTQEMFRKYKNVWFNNGDSNLQGHQYYPETKCMDGSGNFDTNSLCTNGFISNDGVTPTEERIQAGYLNNKPFGTCKGHNGLNAAVLSHDCGGASGCIELDEDYCLKTGVHSGRVGTAGTWVGDRMCLGGTFSKGTWSKPANEPINFKGPYVIGDSSAVLVTYRQCNEAGGKWQIVSEPDISGFQLNNGAYECTGAACKAGHSSSDTCKDDGGEGACDLLGYDNECGLPAEQEEMLFTTSRVNGDSKSHLIQSTGACTGTLDFQLEDTTANQEFAVYKTRIDCSRVSSELLTDKVEISYKYQTNLDLSRDLLKIDAIHSPNVNGPSAEGQCNHPPFTGSGPGENKQKCDAGECVAAYCQVNGGIIDQSGCVAINSQCDQWKTDSDDATTCGATYDSLSSGLSWDNSNQVCTGLDQAICESVESQLGYTWDGPSVVPPLALDKCSSVGTCSNPSVGTSKQVACTGADAVASGNDKYTDPIISALGCSFADGTCSAGGHTTQATCEAAGTCADTNGDVGNGAAHTDATTCNAASDCGTGSDQQCVFTAYTWTSGAVCSGCSAGAAACATAGDDFKLDNGVCVFDVDKGGAGSNVPTITTCTGQDTNSVWTDDLGYSWLQGDFEPTYSVKAFFGGCTDDNQLSGLLSVGTDGRFNFNDDAECTESNYKFHEDFSKNKLELLIAAGGANGNITDGLLALRRCASKDAPNSGVTEVINTAVTPTKASYIITYELAMQYRRDTHTSAFGTADGDDYYLYYCDSQTFTATIDRDATASVTASQIKAAGLNRAVMVKDIGWIGNDEKGSNCNEGYYRLEVLMSSMDSDARSSGNWEKSELTKAMIDTASTASNPNNMRIHAQGMKTIITDPGSVKSMDAGWLNADNQVVSTEGDEFITVGNTFKVRGSCILITECKEDQGSYKPPTGEDWYDFSQNFVTDLVIRGTFLESPVDTKIQLTLNFYECPVTEAAEVTGEIRVGLQTDCTDPQNPMEGDGLDRFYAQSIAQIYSPSNLVSVSSDPVNTCDRSSSLKGVITAGTGGTDSCTHYDCTSAFPDDVLRVSGFSFATISGCSDAASNPAIRDATRAMYTPPLDPFRAECGMFKPEYDEAVDQAWEAELVEVWIDRFDTSQGVPREVSTTQICECDKNDGSDGTNVHPNKCWAVTGGVTNLQDFTTAASLTVNSEFKHYVACGVHGSHDVNAPGKKVCNDIDQDGTVLTDQCNGLSDIKLSSIAGTGNNLFQHQFPLMPLASASADQFVIRYEVVLYSTKLSSRRRLRATKPFRTGSGMISNRASNDKRLVLAGEKFARGSANGFKVISLDHTVRTMGSPGIHAWNDGTNGISAKEYKVMTKQECWDRREDIQLAFDRLQIINQEPGDSGYIELMVGANRDAIVETTLTTGPFGCFIKKPGAAAEYHIYFNPFVPVGDVKHAQCTTSEICLGVEGDASHQGDDDHGDDHDEGMDMGVMIAIIAGSVIVVGIGAFIVYKMTCGKPDDSALYTPAVGTVYGEKSALVGRGEPRFKNLRY